VKLRLSDLAGGALRSWADDEAQLDATERALLEGGWPAELETLQVCFWPLHSGPASLARAARAARVGREETILSPNDRR
jgi:hypothetical protein